MSNKKDLDDLTGEFISNANMALQRGERDFAKGVLSCVDFIKEHRAELEAGRGELRFTYCEEMSLWFPLDKDDARIPLLKSYVFFVTKSECVEFADYFKLTAVFVKSEDSDKQKQPRENET